MLKLAEKVLGSTAAEALSAVSVKCAQVLIQAKRTNSNAMEVGDSTLASGKGIEMVKPTTDATLPQVSISSTGFGNNLDLAEIYVKGTNGEGVNIYYEVF